MTAASRSIPSARAVSKPARAMSSTATSGKVEPVALAGGRVDAGGPGRPEATAERINAHHEIAAGVDRQRRADHALPPARAGISRGGGGMRRGRQPGEQQDGVVARGVEPAPALVGDARAAQHAAPIQRERSGSSTLGGDSSLTVRGARWRGRPFGWTRLSLQGRSHPGYLRTAGSTDSARPCRAASPARSRRARPRAPPAAPRRTWRRSEMPQKMPSRAASWRAQSMASASRHGDDAMGDLAIEHRGHEVRRPALDLVGRKGLARQQRRGRGLGHDDAHLGSREPDDLAGPRQRAAGAPAGHEVSPGAGRRSRPGFPGRWCCGDRPGWRDSRTGAPGTSRASRASSARPCAPCRCRARPPA